MKTSNKITQLRSGVSQIALGSLMVAAGATFAVAGPGGGVVKGGQGTITTQGDLTKIDQDSDRLLIDWRSFDIEAEETVRFDQPDAGSVALNRVNSDSETQISGALEANGNVWIVNQHGVTFNGSARVDVGGLIATTADISGENFMAGRDVFDRPGQPGAKIVNKGNLTVGEVGLTALIGAHVENHGVIEGELTNVVLGGAETFAVDLSGDGLIAFQLDDQMLSTENGPLVQNAGEIRANGGKVLLTAEAAAGLVEAAVSGGGEINVGGDGVISVDAGDGRAEVSGALTAVGGVGRSGGSITVTGEQVHLTSTSRVDASGDSGGGTIRLGGAFQGGPELRAASRTLVSSGAEIDASATGLTGDGGEVIVWADHTTGFFGSIRATGGANAGDGGFAEVSGKQQLAFDGFVDLSAMNGLPGELLLDPENITIVAGDDGDADEDDEFGDLTPTGGVLTLEFDDTPNSFDISAGALQDALENNSVTLQATLDITVQAEVVSETSTTTLRLEAGDDININAPLRHDGDIVLEASADGFGVDGNGYGQADAVGDVELRQRSVIFGAGGSVSGGNVTISGYGDIALGPVTAEAALSVTAIEGYVAGTGAITDTGRISVTGATTINADAEIVLDTPTNDFTDADSAGNAVAQFYASTTVLVVDANTLALGAVQGGSTATITAEDAGESGAFGGGLTNVLLYDDGGDAILSSDLTVGMSVTSLSLDSVGAIDVQGVTLTDVDTTLDATSGVSFGDGTNTFGDLTVTAAAEVNQSAAITAASATITATAADIVLNDATNNFSGTVDLSGRNVTIAQDGDLTLGTVTATISAFVTADNAGDMATFAGDLTMLTLDDTAGDVELPTGFAVPNTVTDFIQNSVGAIEIQGVTLTNVNTALNATDGVSFTTGTSTFGNLVIAAGDTVTQVDSGSSFGINAGSLTVTATGADILLSDVTNAFAGTVSLSGDDISLANSGDLTLGTITSADADGDVTINGDGDVTVRGGAISFDGQANAANDLTVMATGAVTQTESVSVMGDADINAAGQTVDLSDPENDFMGRVDTEGSVVTLEDRNEIQLGQVIATSTLTVTAGGAITDTDGAGIDADDVASFTCVTAGGHCDIALDNDEDPDDMDVEVLHSFAGAVSATGEDITLIAAEGVTLDAITTNSDAADNTINVDGGMGMDDIDPGELVVIARGGAISASDMDTAISVTGDATFEAVTEDGAIFFDISLAQGTINFNSDRDSVPSGLDAAGDGDDARDHVTFLGASVSITAVGDLYAFDSIADASAMLVSNEGDLRLQTIRVNAADGALVGVAADVDAADGVINAFDLSGGAVSLGGAGTTAGAPTGATGAIVVENFNVDQLRVASDLPLANGVAVALADGDAGDVLEVAGQRQLFNFVTVDAFTDDAATNFNTVTGSTAEELVLERMFFDGDISITAGDISVGHLVAKDALTLTATTGDVAKRADGDIDFDGAATANLTVAGARGLMETVVAPTDAMMAAQSFTGFLLEAGGATTVSANAGRIVLTRGFDGPTAKHNDFMAGLALSATEGFVEDATGLVLNTTTIDDDLSIRINSDNAYATVESLTQSGTISVGANPADNVGVFSILTGVGDSVRSVVNLDTALNSFDEVRVIADDATLRDSDGFELAAAQLTGGLNIGDETPGGAQAGPLALRNAQIDGAMELFVDGGVTLDRVRVGETFTVPNSTANSSLDIRNSVFEQGANLLSDGAITLNGVRSEGDLSVGTGDGANLYLGSLYVGGSLSVYAENILQVDDAIDGFDLAVTDMGADVFVGETIPLDLGVDDSDLTGANGGDGLDDNRRVFDDIAGNDLAVNFEHQVNVTGQSSLFVNQQINLSREGAAFGGNNGAEDPLHNDFEGAITIAARDTAANLAGNVYLSDANSLTFEDVRVTGDVSVRIDSDNANGAAESLNQTSYAANAASLISIGGELGVISGVNAGQNADADVSLDKRNLAGDAVNQLGSVRLIANDVTISTNVTIDDGDGFTADAIYATGNVNLATTGMTGDLYLSDAKIAGNLVIDSSGAFVANRIDVGGAVTGVAEDEVIISDILAQNGLTQLTSNTSSITLNDFGLSGFTLNAAGGVFLNNGAGAGSVIASNYVRLHNVNLVGGSFTSTGDVVADGVYSIGTLTLTADSDNGLSGDVILGSVDVQGDLTASGDTIKIIDAVLDPDGIGGAATDIAPAVGAFAAANEMSPQVIVDAVQALTVGAQQPMTAASDQRVFDDTMSTSNTTVGGHDFSRQIQVTGATTLRASSDVLLPREQETAGGPDRPALQNDFQGELDITGRVNNGSGYDAVSGDVVLSDVDSLILDEVNVGGNLSVRINSDNAGGANESLTQTDFATNSQTIIAVGGVLSVITGLDEDEAELNFDFADVSLAKTNADTGAGVNQLSTVRIIGDDVTLSDSNDLAVDRGLVDGALTITTVGDATLSDVKVGDALIVNAGDGAVVTQTDVGAAFGVTAAGDVDVNGVVATNGPTTLTSTGAAVSLMRASLQQTTLSASTFIDVDNILTAGAFTAAAGSNVDVFGANLLQNGQVTAEGDVTVDALRVVGNLDLAADSDRNGVGSVNFGSTNVGGDIAASGFDILITDAATSTVGAVLVSPAQPGRVGASIDLVTDDPDFRVFQTSMMSDGATLNPFEFDHQVDVAGTAALNADNAIILPRESDADGGLNNNFQDTVTISSRDGGSVAGDVFLSDANSLQLGVVAVAGDATIRVNANNSAAPGNSDNAVADLGYGLSQTAGGIEIGGVLSVVTGRDATDSNGFNYADVILTEVSNDFNIVRVIGGDVAFSDADGFVLDRAQTSGDLTLNSGGDIGASDVKVAGSLSVGAGGAAAIARADIGGSTTILAQNEILVTDLVGLGGPTQLQAETSSITVNRAALASATLTASGDIDVDNVVATGIVTANSDADINLYSAYLQVGGSATANGNVTVNAVRSGAALGLNADADGDNSGDVRFGSLYVGGALTAAGENLVITDAAVANTDAVSVIGAAAGLVGKSISDQADDPDLRIFQTSMSSSGAILPALTFDRQIEVTGTSDLDAQQNVYLPRQAGAGALHNDFVGAVSISSASGNVALEDATSLIISDISVANGDLAVRTNSANEAAPGDNVSITQTGAIIVSGGSTFITGDHDGAALADGVTLGDILLSFDGDEVTPGNAFTGGLFAIGNNVALKIEGASELAESRIAGDLAINADNALILSDVDVGGDATVENVQSLTLDRVVVGGALGATSAAANIQATDLLVGDAATLTAATDVSVTEAMLGATTISAGGAASLGKVATEALTAENVTGATLSEIRSSEVTLNGGPVDASGLSVDALTITLSNQAVGIRDANVADDFTIDTGNGAIGLADINVGGNVNVTGGAVATHAESEETRLRVGGAMTIASSSTALSDLIVAGDSLVGSGGDVVIDDFSFAALAVEAAGGIMLTDGAAAATTLASGGVTDVTNARLASLDADAGDTAAFDALIVEGAAAIDTTSGNIVFTDMLVGGTLDADAAAGDIASEEGAGALAAVTVSAPTALSLPAFTVEGPGNAVVGVQIALPTSPVPEARVLETVANVADTGVDAVSLAQGDDVSLAEVALQNLLSAGGVAVIDAEGDVTISDAAFADALDIDAGGSSAISSTSAIGNASIAAGADADVTESDFGSALDLSAGGEAVVAGSTVAGAAAVNASGNAEVASTTIGDALGVAADGAALISATITGAAATVSATDNATVAGSTIGSGLGVNAGGSASVTDSSVTAVATIASGADTTITMSSVGDVLNVDAGGAASISATTTGGATSVSAVDNAIVDGSTFGAGLGVDAGGPAALTGSTVAAAAIIASGADVTIAMSSAGGDLDVDAGGAVSVSETAIDGSTNVDAVENIAVSAATLQSLAATSTAGDIDLQNGDIATDATLTGGAVRAAEWQFDSLTVDARSTVDIDNVEVSGLADIDAQTNVKVNNLAFGDLDIASSSGGLVLRNSDIDREGAGDGTANLNGQSVTVEETSFNNLLISASGEVEMTDVTASDVEIGSSDDAVGKVTIGVEESDASRFDDLTIFSSSDVDIREFEAIDVTVNEGQTVLIIGKRGGGAIEDRADQISGDLTIDAGADVTLIDLGVAGDVSVNATENAVVQFDEVLVGTLNVGEEDRPQNFLVDDVSFEDEGVREGNSDTFLAIREPGGDSRIDVIGNILIDGELRGANAAETPVADSGPNLTLRAGETIRFGRIVGGADGSARFGDVTIIGNSIETSVLEIGQSELGVPDEGDLLDAFVNDDEGFVTEDASNIFFVENLNLEGSFFRASTIRNGDTNEAFFTSQNNFGVDVDGVLTVAATFSSAEGGGLDLTGSIDEVNTEQASLLIDSTADTENPATLRFNNCTIGDASDCSISTLVDFTPDTDLPTPEVLELNIDELADVYSSAGNEELWAPPPVFTEDYEEEE